MSRSSIGSRGTIVAGIALLIATAFPAAAAMSAIVGRSIGAPHARALPAGHPRGAMGNVRGERRGVPALGEPGGQRRFVGRGPAPSKFSGKLADRGRAQPAHLHSRIGDHPYERRQSPTGFGGWRGPEYWPEAYRDIHGNAFWPQRYGRTFWAFAFDDIFTGIFWPRSFAVASETTGRAGHIGGNHDAKAQAATLSPEFARICSEQAPGLTGWSFERIRQAVAPTEAQKLVFDELKNASAHAVETLRIACPTEMPPTPAAMLRAVRGMIPPLAKFYDLLDADQKTRFNTMSAQGG